ncbi:hypothetical protein PENTCL1PPCAC_4955, partial [Pristionchus entomophagus]
SRSDSLSFLGTAVSLHCGVVGCKFAQHSIHFHCSYERCSFAARSTAAISAHLTSFHSLGPIPNHLTYTHADSSCLEKSCFLSGESHFHCSKCHGQFFAGNSQGTHRCDPEKQRAMMMRRNAVSFPPPQHVHKACNRPYCKLKKNIVHFHCLVCSQGFTSHDRLASHLRKHQRADLRQSASAAGTVVRLVRQSTVVPRVCSSPPPNPIPQPPATVIRRTTTTTTTVFRPALGIHPEMLRMLQRGPGIAAEPGIRG